tara:strand:+ start:347 stop:1024 length:678 start_codon:yes stop_codon:yes gene_type:complete
MSKKSNEVGEFFSSFSKDWDTLYGEKRNIFMRIIDYILRRDIYERYALTFKSLNDEIKGSSVLDIGCGNGIYSIDAVKRGAKKVIGIDVADEMIEICNMSAKKENINDNLEFIVSNFPVTEEMAISIGPLDYSIVMGVMDYVYDPVPFLKQLRLMTNKKTCVTFPGGKVFRYNLRKYRYKLLGRVHVMGYKSNQEVYDLMKASGFTDIKINYLNHSGGCYFVEAE